GQGGQDEYRWIPTARRDVQGVHQPAVHFIGKRDGGHQILGVSPFGLGDRKARRDVVAWMNGKSTDIRVVEVEEAERCAIGEGCKIRRGAPTGADDRGATGHGKCNLATDADRSFLERSDTAADRVNDVYLDPLDGRGVEVVVAQGMGIGGQLFRERSLAWC